MNGAPATPPSRTRVLLAWCVHGLTASGAVVGTLAIVAIAGGELERAAILMLVALAIDSVDGALARAVGTAEAVPIIDGRRLDDVTDYLNYVIVPVLFMLASGALPHWAWGAAPILASAYGFSRHDAKTSDDFFLGFPSYWNVVALYLWLLALPASVATPIVLAFSVLVLVPLRYVYPSHTPVARRFTNAAATLWILVVALAVMAPERARVWRLVELSLAFPIYYLCLSALVGGWGRRAGEPVG